MWSSCIALLIASGALSHNYAPRTAYHQLLTSNVKEDMYKFEPHAHSCGGVEFRRNFMQVIWSGTCNNPRDTLLPVTPEDPSTEIYPSYVKVMRCQGMCTAIQACLPSTVVITKIPVRRKSADDQLDCGFVHVEEHVRCTCGCAVMEGHCNDFQNCDSQNGYQALLSRSVKKERHKFEKHGKGCNDKEFIRNFKNVVISAYCGIPRLTVVHVTPVDRRTQFFPNYVEVKRCQGACSRTHACLPTKVVTKKIPVFRMDVKGQKDCGFVHVEEHVICKCGCAVMEEHCNELQEFNSKECMCVCKKDMEGKSNCEAKGQVWNMDRCDCD